MVNGIKIVTLIVGLLGFGSCGKDGLFSKDDQLSLALQDYTGNQLRIDGYYYFMSNNKLFSVSFFYSNGVYLDTGGGFQNVEEIDDYINEVFLNINDISKYRWGAFLIENNSLRFERWHPSSGGPLRASVREGVILNDTTFQITEVYRNQNGKKSDLRTVDEVYQFRKFSPKPDSTNRFVP